MGAIRITVWVLVLCALAAAPSFAVTTADYTKDTVTPETAVPQVVTGSDGDVYALFTSNGEFRRYAPSTNTWSGGLSALPTGVGWAIGATPNGHIYAVGGPTAATVDDYDIATNSWTSVAPIPTPVTYAAVVGGVDGNLYVLGGEEPSSDSCGPTQLCYSDETQIYHPSTNTWTTGSPPPTFPITQTAAIQLSDGWIYLPGTAEAYNPATDAWKALAAAPQPAQSTTVGYSATADGHIVQFTDNQLTSDVTVSVYTPGSDKWITGQPESLPVCCAGIALAGGEVHLIGLSGQVQREHWGFLDVTPPQGSIQIDGGATSTTNPTVTITDSATDTSGVDSLRLSNDPATTGGVLTNGTTFPDPASVAWTLAGGAGGAKTVWAQWRDPFGNWSAPVSAAITLNAAPTITGLPAPTLPTSGRITTTAPVTLTWSATDANPIAAYDLYQSTDGGPEVSVFDGDATQATRHVAFGHTYTYRVTATDNQGLTGSGTAAPFSLSLAQQTAATFQGTWHTATGSTYNGGSVAYTSKAGASAEYTFTGSAISIIGTKGPTRGKLKVYIDGTLSQTVDTSATKLATQTVIYTHTWATSATHTIEIVCNATSGRPRIDLDGFVTIR